MEFKKDDSRRIQESPFECLNIVPLFFYMSLTKGTVYLGPVFFLLYKQFLCCIILVTNGG